MAFSNRNTRIEPINPVASATHGAALATDPTSGWTALTPVSHLVEPAISGTYRTVPLNGKTFVVATSTWPASGRALL